MRGPLWVTRWRTDPGLQADYQVWGIIWQLSAKTHAGLSAGSPPTPGPGGAPGGAGPPQGWGNASCTEARTNARLHTGYTPTTHTETHRLHTDYTHTQTHDYTHKRTATHTNTPTTHKHYT